MLSTDLPKSPGIYKMYFLTPDLLYIGSAINLRKRYNYHHEDLRKGKHGNRHLQSACNKYGIDALHFEIVEHVERKEDLLIREQHYIDTLQPHYNISPTAGSNLGRKASDETIERLRISHKGKPSPKKGIPQPPEEQERLRTLTIGVPSWNKGKPWPPEQQERLRTMNIGRPNPHPGVRGPHKFTPESLETVRAKNRAAYAAKSPEERERDIEKWRATRATNKAAKLALSEQASLWDDTALSS